MGELFIRKLTPADVMWVCDNCNQSGLKENGKEVRDNAREVFLWFCYNCVNQKKV